ncbi:MAG: PEP/pyruvate-binding domain-containing protein [Candidatus Paceibacterota bacterium]|jgi:phosphohistidine swiveling domain-containing protein
MKLTLNFKQLNKTNADIAGGKGASLGEMTQAGIPVPPGFVVLSTTFETFIKEADLAAEIDTIIDNVNHKDINSVETASEKIQALIKNASMPENIAKEIEEQFKLLDTEYVAVRSSATAEDGADNAWAGQLDSYLNTKKENLLEKVQHCWASLFTPRAIFYRFEKGLHTTKISVAVVVQKMVNSEISGIAFSVHPVTEDRNQMIIEAGFGLGEAIVSGQVTPDSYVVEKEPRRIIDTNINTQTRGLYRVQTGGNEWIDIPEPKASSQVLTDSQVLDFTDFIMRIENHYGFPCDIEWAYEKNTFYIVQSRPITTLKKDIDILNENWQKIWTTEYSLFSIWLFGKNFTDICFKEVGVGFSNVIFSLNGDLATLFRLDHEQKAFSKKFANRMIFENGYKEKVRKIVIESQKEFEKFKKMKEKDFLTTNNFLNFLKIHYRFIPHYLGNLWTPNEFASIKASEDEKNNVLEFCLTLRKSTETILPDLEKFLQKIFEFIAQLKKIDKKLLRSISPDEMLLYIQSGVLPNSNVLEKRYGNTAVWARTTGIELFTDTEATKLINKIYKADKGLKELRGEVAQKGIHKGIVKIMFSEKDMLKIKNGDVIVTTMTRPEWVPVMKIAGAFVTDAGSVLCHAAIVARELNKPCIISAKIATQVLKDGDLVEVDADNGTVKIIRN